MKHSLWLLVTICIASAAAQIQAQTTEDYYGFADILYSKGDYYRAITEYERFIYLAPSNQLVPIAQFKIGMAYFSGSKLAPAASQFSDVKLGYRDTKAGRDAAMMLGETYYRMGQFEKAEGTWAEYVEQYPADEQASSARLRQGICLLRLGDKESALETVSLVPSASPLRKPADDIAAAISGYGDIPRKSPRTAAALSALLPGAGQLYVDRPHDALVSFTLNGLMIWGMLEAFDNDEEVAGSFIAVMESVWYVGNIYNAANSANKFNARAKDKFFDDLRIKCGLMGAAQGFDSPAMGLSISSKF